MGVIWSFADETEYSSESVLGFGKHISVHYNKMGFEIGKIYYTTKRGRLHTFSIAPTYTEVFYSMGDSSGNFIGWTDDDNYKCEEFLRNVEGSSNGRVGGFGIEIGYTYQFIGINLSVTKKAVEFSFQFQIDMKMKCVRDCGVWFPF